MSVNGKNRRRSYVRRALCFVLLVITACLLIPAPPAKGGDDSAPDGMSRQEWERIRRKGAKKAGRWDAKRTRIHIAQQSYDLGKELFFEQNYREAERLFREAIRLLPIWQLPHSFLGQIFLEYHKDYIQAIQHLEIAAQNKSAEGRQIALYYLAQAYAGAGQMRRAWETWQEYFKICTPGTKWETKAREYAAAVKVSLEAAGKPSPSPSPASSPR